MYWCYCCSSCGDHLVFFPQTKPRIRLSLVFSVTVSISRFRFFFLQILVCITLNLFPTAIKSVSNFCRFPCLLWLSSNPTVALPSFIFFSRNFVPITFKLFPEAEKCKIQVLCQATLNHSSLFSGKLWNSYLILYFHLPMT